MVVSVVVDGVGTEVDAAVVAAALNTAVCIVDSKIRLIRETESSEV